MAAVFLSAGDLAELQLGAQLGFPLAHGLSALVERLAQVTPQPAGAFDEVVGHPLGRVPLGGLAQGLLQPVGHAGAQPDPDTQPEEALEHAAYTSSLARKRFSALDVPAPKARALTTGFENAR